MEVLIHSITECILGKRVFKEIIGLRRALGWALIQYDWCPPKRKKFAQRHIQRKDHAKTQGTDIHLEAKEGGLRRNQHG